MKQQKTITMSACVSNNFDRYQINNCISSSIYWRLSGLINDRGVSDKIQRTYTLITKQSLQWSVINIRAIANLHFGGPPRNKTKILQEPLSSVWPITAL